MTQRNNIIQFPKVKRTRGRPKKIQNTTKADVIQLPVEFIRTLTDTEKQAIDKFTKNIDIILAALAAHVYKAVDTKILDGKEVTLNYQDVLPNSEEKASFDLNFIANASGFYLQALVTT